jgi:hypothetical protein
MREAQIVALTVHELVYSASQRLRVAQHDAAIGEMDSFTSGEEISTIACCNGKIIIIDMFNHFRSSKLADGIFLKGLSQRTRNPQLATPIGSINAFAGEIGLSGKREKVNRQGDQGKEHERQTVPPPG